MGYQGYEGYEGYEGYKRYKICIGMANLAVGCITGTVVGKILYFMYLVGVDVHAVNNTVCLSDSQSGSQRRVVV